MTSDAFERVCCGQPILPVIWIRLFSAQDSYWVFSGLKWFCGCATAYYYATHVFYSLTACNKYQANIDMYTPTNIYAYVSKHA